MLEKKNKLCVQIMLFMHNPILNGIFFIVTGKFFLRNQMKTRQENVNF